MSTPAAARSGPDHLRQEMALLTELCAALEAERTGLESRDAEGLLVAVAAKSDAFARLANLVRQRPLPTAEFRSLPGYAELDALLRRSRRQNDTNGALIRGQRRRVDGLLSLLTGVPAGGATYGRDGAAGNGPRSRGAIASA